MNIPKKDDTIQIVLAVYDPSGKYSRHAGVVMTSIFTHTSRPVRVTILHDETLSEDNRARFQKTAEASGQTVRFTDVSASLARMGDDPDGIAGSYSRGCLFRLLLPEATALSKVIYLDCDIAVSLDIGELWDMDIEDASLAVVEDAGVIAENRKLHGKIRSWAMGYDGGRYFNSGVLLMNLNRIRETYDFAKEAEYFFKRYRHCIDYPDQDLLNALFQGDVRYIDEKFDRIKDRHNVGDAILHLTGKNKPWAAPLCEPRDYFYWETFACSEWRDQLVDALLDVYKNNPAIHHHTSDCLRYIRERWKKDLFVKNGVVKLIRDLTTILQEFRCRIADARHKRFGKNGTPTAKGANNAVRIFLHRDAPRKSLDYRFLIQYRRCREFLYFVSFGLRHRRMAEKYRYEFEESVGNLKSDLPQNALYVYARGVGEVQSALPLVREVRKSQTGSIVLAVRSREGRLMAETIFHDEADAIIYGPWDAPQFVTRTLDILRPKACIVVDLEPTPMPIMLHELLRRGIPMFLVNANIPERRETQWNRRRPFWSGVLDCFDKIMTRSESDRKCLLQMGLSESKIIVTGNCKIDGLLTRKNDLDTSRLELLKSPRTPLFIAGSTRGEEEIRIVVEAFAQVRGRIPSARLILAPRLLRETNFAAETTYSQGKTEFFSTVLPDGSSAIEDKDWDILIVDKIGVLLGLYSIADAAFVGGSLVPQGGHNLMEPAVYGIPVVHGPYMRDFPESIDMDACGASRTVHDAAELSRAWLDALNPEFRARTEAACRNYFQSAGGAAEQSWKIIQASLENR